MPDAAASSASRRIKALWFGPARHRVWLDAARGAGASERASSSDGGSDGSSGGSKAARVWAMWGGLQWVIVIYGRHTTLLFVHISPALMCLLTTRLESTAALAYVESMGETTASQSFSTS